MEKVDIKSKILLVLALGVILTLTSVLLNQNLEDKYSPAIGILNTIGKTFMGSALVALLLRLPALLEQVNTSAIKLLTNNEYLKRLSIDQLAELRAAATQNAYIKSTNSANTSLNLLDAQIGKLFLEPYYQSFNMNFRCRMLDGDLIEKTISTSFTFKNPKKDRCNAFDFFSFRVVQEKITGLQDEQMRKIERFQVIKDGIGDFVDYTPAYFLDFSDHNEESSNYDVVSVLKKSQANTNLDLEFDNTLHLKFVEKRIVPKSDKIYINRITSPTEKFLINYSFDGCNVNLLGTGFGTFQNTKDGGINIFKDPNSIQIASEKWLLTGNGIMIVHEYI